MRKLNVVAAPKSDGKSKVEVNEGRRRLLAAVFSVKSAVDWLTISNPVTVESKMLTASFPSAVSITFSFVANPAAASASLKSDASFGCATSAV